MSKNDIRIYNKSNGDICLLNYLIKDGTKLDKYYLYITPPETDDSCDSENIQGAGFSITKEDIIWN